MLEEQFVSLLLVITMIQQTMEESTRILERILLLLKRTETDRNEIRLGRFRSPEKRSNKNIGQTSVSSSRSSAKSRSVR